MRVMSGTLLMPVWTRRSWRPQGLISHKWVFGEAEGNSDMIKLVASRTSDWKVSLFFPLSWSWCGMCHCECNAWCDVMLHAFTLCPCAVIVMCPIHAFPLPDALPRPVSLSQPASFQPTSLPVQPLPKWGAFQSSPTGVPRVQAGSGIHLFPWALPCPWPRFRLWLQLSTALAAKLGLSARPLTSYPLFFHISPLTCLQSFSCLLLYHLCIMNLRMLKSLILNSQLIF